MCAVRTYDLNATSLLNVIIDEVATLVTSAFGSRMCGASRAAVDCVVFGEAYG